MASYFAFAFAVVEDMLGMLDYLVRLKRLDIFLNTPMATLTSPDKGYTTPFNISHRSNAYRPL
jgi:hypothetical protein